MPCSRPRRAIRALLLAIGVSTAAAPGPAAAQREDGTPELRAADRATGLEIGGVPALNFDADQGFGYGVVAALYQYGDGSVAPYRWTLQPTVFLTTEGRRDITVFFDAPELVGRWRVGVFAGTERQLGTPWYGVGNTTSYDPALEAGANPWYYRFGRTRRSLLVNLQRPLGATAVRVLVGGGFVHATATPVPEGEGTTLLARQLAEGRPLVEGWLNHVRVGLVWDTRDRETAPRRGTWSDLLIQRVDPALGSEVGYTRWTLTDRRYLPIGPVTLAHRILLQGTGAEVPLVDLHRVQTSFRDQEGLGGSNSVRGVLWNRYAGRGMMIWNVELRWRFADFDVFGRDLHLVASTFADAGRVWKGAPRLDEMFTDLHRGWGGGLRIGMGPDFAVAIDAATGSETGLQVYIGLGYLY